VTSPAPASTDRIRRSPLGLSSSPSQIAAPVNEWAEPVIRTVAGLVSPPDGGLNLPSRAGVMISRGVTDSVPAQLRQVAVLLPAMPGRYRIPAAWLPAASRRPPDPSGKLIDVPLIGIDTDQRTSINPVGPRRWAIGVDKSPM
jgi:hypothetical protein